MRDVSLLVMCVCDLVDDSCKWLCEEEVGWNELLC